MVATALLATFAGSLPGLRSHAELDAVIGAAASGQASAVQAAAVARIESLVADGDRASRLGATGAALAAFEQARAEIYRLISPRFNVGQYLLSERPALAVSAAIEQDLLHAATQIVEVVRPALDAPRPAAWVAEVAPEDGLALFTQLGLRETQPTDELLAAASEQGVALMAAGRPEAGLQVLEVALANAAPGADSGLLAALHLNRAAAWLQMGESASAAEAAQTAAEMFSAAQDEAGIAQAAHLQGIAAMRQGDNQTADQLFGRAAEMAGRLQGRRTTVGAPDGPGIRIGSDGLLDLTRTRLSGTTGEPSAIGRARSTCGGPLRRRGTSGS